MTLRRYLFLILLLVIVFWSSFIILLFNTNPYKSNFFLILLMYILIALGISGIFFLLNFTLKLKLKKNIVAIRELKISFRQSLLLSLFIILFLYLSHLGFIRWWNIIILFLIFILVELFIKNLTIKNL